METRLAYLLIVVGWGFIVGGAAIFCSAVWNIVFDGQSEKSDNLIGAAMAAFVSIAGLLFVLRSRKVLKGEV